YTTYTRAGYVEFSGEEEHMHLPAPEHTVPDFSHTSDDEIFEHLVKQGVARENAISFLQGRGSSELYQHAWEAVQYDETTAPYIYEAIARGNERTNPKTKGGQTRRSSNTGYVALLGAVIATAGVGMLRHEGVSGDADKPATVEVDPQAVAMEKFLERDAQRTKLVYDREYTTTAQAIAGEIQDPHEPLRGVIAALASNNFDEVQRIQEEQRTLGRGETLDLPKGQTRVQFDNQQVIFDRAVRALVAQKIEEYVRAKNTDLLLQIMDGRVFLNPRLTRADIRLSDDELRDPHVVHVVRTYIEGIATPSKRGDVQSADTVDSYYMRWQELGVILPTTESEWPEIRVAARKHAAASISDNPWAYKQASVEWEKLGIISASELGHTSEVRGALSNQIVRRLESVIKNFDDADDMLRGYVILQENMVEWRGLNILDDALWNDARIQRQLSIMRDKVRIHARSVREYPVLLNDVKNNAVNTELFTQAEVDAW
nr:hypothetical protein [Candidatus Kerfeldbacteria bacterium]